MLNISRTYRSASLAIVAAAFLITPAQAQMQYEISIEEPEAVSSDLDMIETIYGSAAEGDEINGSVRRLINAVNGEMDLLVGNRINENGELILDDGTLETLYEGDEVNVKPIRRIREVIIGCRFVSKKNNLIIIPACKRVCDFRKRLSLPAICNEVPPRRIVKKN